MIIPKEHKSKYWFGLIIASSLIIYARVNEIVAGNTNAIDTLIVITLVALLLLPIFSEMEFFGFKFKSEFETLRTNVKSDIINLRSDILNSINIAQSQNVYVDRKEPPNDIQIQQIEDIVRQKINDELEGRGLVSIPTSDDYDFAVPDNDVFLFQVRYEIERALMNIYQTENIVMPRKFMSVGQMVRHLGELNVLDRNIQSILEDIVNIGNAGVHGRKISEKQMDYVKSLFPDVLRVLRNYEGNSMT